MNADPRAQRRLLDLQAVDTALSQHRHRREHLPELAEIAALEERLGRLRDDEVQAQAEADDRTREQKRIDRDVDQVRIRVTKDNARMLAGGLPAKELAGLEHELQSLARRQSELEDTELDVMQQVEDAEKQLAATQADAAALGAELGQLVERRDAAYTEIDAEVTDLDAERGMIAGELPADLTALYEKVRVVNGGVGAAALRHGRCEGCRIELPPNELDAARRADPPRSSAARSAAASWSAYPSPGCEPLDRPAVRRRGRRRFAR